MKLEDTIIRRYSSQKLQGRLSFPSNCQYWFRIPKPEQLFYCFSPFYQTIRLLMATIFAYPAPEYCHIQAPDFFVWSLKQSFAETGLHWFGSDPIQENPPLCHGSPPQGLSEARRAAGWFSCFLVTKPLRGRPIGGGGTHHNWERDNSWSYLNPTIFKRELPKNVNIQQGFHLLRFGSPKNVVTVKTGNTSSSRSAQGRYGGTVLSPPSSF